MADRRGDDTRRVAFDRCIRLPKWGMVEHVESIKPKFEMDTVLNQFYSPGP
jgi:hypothetical protein